jgi:antirestriction protein ArdC
VARVTLSEEERKARRDAAADYLSTQTQQLTQAPDFQAALRFSARLRSIKKPYSMSNMFLLLAQRPDATLVMSFDAWKTLGRTVKKGEKGLMIWHPMPQRTKPEAGAPSERTSADNNGDAGGMALTGKTPTRSRFFIRNSAFDLSQTDGDPLPEYPRPKPITESLENLETYWDAVLAELTERLGITFANDAPLPGWEGHGYYRPKDKHVWVSNELSRTEQFAVLLHEGAHALCAHHETRRTADYAFNEVVAESTSFLMLDAFGLSQSQALDHSMPYLAGYAKTPEVLLKGIEAARTVAQDFEASVMRRLDPTVVLNPLAALAEARAAASEDSPRRASSTGAGADDEPSLDDVLPVRVQPLPSAPLASPALAAHEDAETSEPPTPRVTWAPVTPSPLPEPEGTSDAPGLSTGVLNG